MEQNIRKYIIFELVEKLYRFLSHLEDVERQFYSIHKTNNEKHFLFESFRDSLYTILLIVVKSKDKNRNSSTM